jgi:hypothetical protein
LATKGRFPTSAEPNGVGLSRRHLDRALHASLRRLGVDTIDPYQVHVWDPLAPIQETLIAPDIMPPPSTRCRQNSRISHPTNTAPARTRATSPGVDLGQLRMDVDISIVQAGPFGTPLFIGMQASER